MIQPAAKTPAREGWQGVKCAALNDMCTFVFWQRAGGAFRQVVKNHEMTSLTPLTRLTTSPITSIRSIRSTKSPNSNPGHA